MINKFDSNGIKEVLKNSYDLKDPEIFFPLDDSINDVYIVFSEGNLYGFKIYSFYNKKEENLHFENEIINRLTQIGVGLPYFIETKSKDIFLKLGLNYCALSTYVKGNFFQDENLEHYAESGRILAEIHRLSLEPSLEGISYIPSMKEFSGLFGDSLSLDQLIDFNQNHLDKETSRKLSKLYELEDELAEMERNICIVHGEYDKKVLRFDKNKIVGLLDFEGSRIDDSFFDLVNSYRTIGCFNRDITSPSLSKFLSFINGYRSVNPIEEKDYVKFLTTLKFNLGSLIVARLYYYWKTQDSSKFKGENIKLLKEIDWIEENGDLILGEFFC